MTRRRTNFSFRLPPMTHSPQFKVDRIAALGSLADRVTEALSQLIRGSAFSPGARLPSEKEMAGRFGVSRTVMREAISRLKSEGLVESRHGVGIFVRDLTLDATFRINPGVVDSVRSVLQVVELRKPLEAEIAALAAERCTKAQLADIQRALKQIDKSVRAGSDGVDADIAFHRSIAQATGNPHFLALTEFVSQFLRGAMQVTRAFEASKETMLLQVKEEHRAIVDAIAAQDPVAARAAARAHMENATRRLSTADQDFWSKEGGRHARQLTDSGPVRSS